jgi:hypothetical protein
MVAPTHHVKRSAHGLLPTARKAEPTDSHQNKVRIERREGADVGGIAEQTVKY